MCFLKHEPLCVYTLAAALDRAGKHEEVVRHLRELPLTKTPLETHGDLLLALCLHHLGKKGEARAALAKAAARLDARETGVSRRRSSTTTGTAGSICSSRTI